MLCSQPLAGWKRAMSEWGRDLDWKLARKSIVERKWLVWQSQCKKHSLYCEHSILLASCLKEWKSDSAQPTIWIELESESKDRERKRERGRGIRSRSGFLQRKWKRIRKPMKWNYSRSFCLNFSSFLHLFNSKRSFNLEMKSRKIVGQWRRVEFDNIGA